MPLNLPEQPDWEPVPPEEEPTIGAADPRYHVIFSDAPDQATEVERLGLMLTESGPIGFNVQMTSPFSGQLGGPGQREDKDLSRYTVRSQRDWRGGRGQLTTYADTDRFHDSLADTRFPNQVLLPPASTKIALAAVTGPEFTPSSSSAITQARVSAGYTNSSRTAANQTAHATYTLAESSDPAYEGNGAGVLEAQGLYLRSLFQKFVPASNVTATTVQLKVAEGVLASDGLRVVIQTNTTVDGVDRPSGTVVWNHEITGSEDLALTTTPTWMEFTGDAPYALTGGTKYWVGIYAAALRRINVQVGAPAYGQMLVEAAGSGSFTNVSQILTAEMLFRINAGTLAVDDALTRVRLAQSFVAGSSNTIASVRLNIARVTWAAGSTVGVRIETNSGGSPSGTLVTGGSGTITMPTDTSVAWATVAMTPTLVSGTTYWLVLTPNSSTFSNNVTLTWTGSTSGTGTAKTATETSGSWGAWSTISGVQLHFGITWSATGDIAEYNTHDLIVVSRAQSFTTDPTTAVTPTKVRAYLQLIGWVGSPTLTLGIYSNSAGVPGSLVYSASLSQSTFTGQGAVLSANWVEVSPTTPGALSLNTLYWIVLTPTAPTINDSVSVDWQVDSGANFATGSMAVRTVTNGSGSWAAGTTGYDAFFIINDGRGSSSAVTIRPVRFGDGWYIAAGLNVYKLNTSTSQFDLKYTAAATITALCSYAGYLYAALGDSNDMARTPDGTSWDTAALAGKRYTHLLSYNGYMYAAKSVGATDGLAYYNGSTWSPNIVLANASVTVSDLIGFGNELLITATTGLWALSSNLVYQVLDFSNEQYAGNGVNSLTWMADGRLYIPIGQSLHAYDGTRLIPVGLDLEEGLPLDQQGHVSCLVGTRAFLFASVDGGTTSRSGIYAFNGKGWHCLAQASTPGRRIRSMGLEQITSTTSRPRLWYFEDGTPYFLEFPDLTDNPNGYLDSAGDGIAYLPQGYVTSSWIGGELSAVSKDFQSIIVASTGCTSAGRTIDLFIEVDRSGIWLPVGTVTRSPIQEYVLLSRTWGPLTVTATIKGTSTVSVIFLGENGALTLQAGDFVRIGEEVRQIAQIDSSDSIYFSIPLAEIPAEGTIVYPARPSGREIRYKAVLNSNYATYTPVLQRVSVKMQERLIDKFRFTLTVRLEDALRLHGSIAEADLYTAAELRAKLYKWIKRLGPFYMTDPGGTVYRVKIAYASESGWTRTNDNGDASWRSQMTIVLDET